MTPEEAARFILSDCHDPILRQKAEAETDVALAEALKDPAFKARWDARIQAMAAEIDRRAADDAYGMLDCARHQP